MLRWGGGDVIAPPPVFTAPFCACTNVILLVQQEERQELSKFVSFLHFLHSKVRGRVLSEQTQRQKHVLKAQHAGFKPNGQTDLLQ